MLAVGAGLVVRAEEDAVGGVVVQVLPDHDGHRVHAGVHRPHPLQGTVTAAVDVVNHHSFYRYKVTQSVHLLALSLTPCQQTTGVEQVAAPVSRARMAALSTSIVTLSTLVTAVMCSVPAAEREPSELQSATWEQFDAQHSTLSGIR